MRCLLIAAHGSRREQSNQEVRALAAQLRSQLGVEIDRIECCFLELAEPDIPTALDQAAAAGADTVILLPYFLSAGRHVAEDIPAIVAAARDRHPALDIQLTPYLGQAQELLPLIAGLARQSY